MKKNLLVPLGPEGNNQYRVAVFNYHSDRPMEAPLRTAPDSAVLVLDGEFLNRQELQAFLDFKIFVHASAHICLQRTLLRDREPGGGPLDVMERFEKRYLPADRLYQSLAQPQSVSDVIVRNNRVAQPELILSKWVSRAPSRNRPSEPVTS